MKRLHFYLVLAGLLFLSVLGNSQHAAFAVFDETIAYLDFDRGGVVVLHPSKPKKQAFIEFPEVLGSPIRSGGAVSEIFIDQWGKCIYWHYQQEVWRHTLKEYKPFGEWQLLLEYPRSQGQLQQIDVNREGNQMLLFVDLNRSNITQRPFEVSVWGPTILQADISRSDIFLSEPLLVSDSLRIQKAWHVNDYFFLVEITNEVTGKREIRQANRLYGNHWEIQPNALFEDFEIYDGPVGQTWEKSFLLRSESGYSSGDFSYIQLAQKRNSKDNYAAPEYYWYWPDKMPEEILRIDKGNLDLPAGSFMLPKLLPLGGYVIAAERIFEEENGQKVVKSILHYPQSRNGQITGEKRQKSLDEFTSVIGAGRYTALLLSSSSIGGIHKLWSFHYESGELQLLYTY